MTGFHAPQILPGLYSADIINRDSISHPTYVIRLTFDSKKPPLALIDALTAGGFVHKPLPADVAAEDYLLVVDFSKPGNGPFGHWTAEQMAENHAMLQGIFETAGIAFAPHVTRGQGF